MTGQYMKANWQFSALRLSLECKLAVYCIKENYDWTLLEGRLAVFAIRKTMT